MLAALRQPRQMFADQHTGRSGANRLELAANGVGCIRLRIEGLMLRRSARLEQVDDGLFPFRAAGGRGSAGVVGEIMLQVLIERHFPLRAVKFLASERSAGKSLQFKGETYTIEPIRPAAFAGVDIVLSSTPASVSRESSPMAAQ